ncbi:hypothetical protein BN000_03080 [Neobacillus massiliamazoniensis]|uniref:Uncharacterized protein n=1 Tax=Neobacillus massiliamazoniensis TaxID=1499688 RepID=A0A0U1NZ68_9BACI|nr:hypothetical protein BN000_03080 [Neobacillus massiliamazoniensis]
MSFNLKSKVLEKKKRKETLVRRLYLLLQQNRKLKTNGEES